MQSEYVGLLVILAAAVAVALAVLGVQQRIAPRRRLPAKQEPVECGEPPLVAPRARFSVRFHRVAILFLVFHAASLYFHPWGATFREVGWPGFVGIALFALPLVVGLAYQWAKGALEW